MGQDVPDWPKRPDPAMIAVYMCRQKQSDFDKLHSGVKYKLLVRPDVQLINTNSGPNSPKILPAEYIDMSQNAADLLDKMKRDLMGEKRSMKKSRFSKFFEF